MPIFGTSILGSQIKNKYSACKEGSKSVRLKFYDFKPILSWETSLEQWHLGLLPWTSRLVDSQQPQTPSMKVEK